jgi:pilus assembly protein CpaB
MKQKLILIVSVIIGLLAAMLTRSYLNAKDREVERWKTEFNRKNAKIEVVAVKKDLPSGTVLTMADLVGVFVIEKSVKGHVVKVQDHLSLVGRKTLRALQKESPLFWSDIEGGEPGSRGLAGDIKTRMRAISVNVSGAASVSGMVKPNDHVDVLGTFSFPSKTVPGELELVTLTILQDVLVLATGKETAKTQLLGDNRSAAYNSVTLEVTPREAEMLVFSEQIKGRISLALRNPDDVYFEKTLPRVNFEMIQSEIESLNTFRQQQLLRKRTE